MCSIVVRLLDVRGSVKLKEMTDAELQWYGAPTFLPDESPKFPIVGFLPVARRVIMELFAPGDWKARNFTPERAEALAERIHARKCWHFPICDELVKAKPRALATGATAA